MDTDALPLFWRIRNNEQAGQEAVSLLMPMPGETKLAEFPTSVSVAPETQATSQNQPLDVRWSDEDTDLFMSLLDRVMDFSESPELVVDVTDELVQGIVQLVALVRFKHPWNAEQILGRDINVPREELDIGDLVALNTCYGFFLAIVVKLDSLDAVCILLEPLKNQAHKTVLPESSVLQVSRMAIVPSMYCDSESPVDQLLQ